MFFFLKKKKKNKRILTEKKLWMPVDKKVVPIATPVLNFVTSLSLSLSLCIRRKLVVK
jgi:hypothetical protein